MAHATNHPFVYDCGTCAGPVHYSKLEWVHSNRRSECATVVVVAVPLTKIDCEAELATV